MRKTITTYTCDGCGSEVERPRDLRKFTLVAATTSGRNRYRDAPTTEVCDPCEEKLLALFAPFVADEKGMENLAELRRDPPRA